MLEAFDLKQLIGAESDPSNFGFSLEFLRDAAGMGGNYWSLEGLFEAGGEVVRLCRQRS